MNCSGCGAAMRLDTGRECLKCEYCQTLHLLDPDAGGVRTTGLPAEGVCPVCALGLLRAVAAGIELSACPRCRGLLIGMESFLVLMTELRARRDGPPEQPRPPEPEALRRTIACPHCRRPMHTHYYAGPGNIVIDNCPECAVNWLDHAELRRVVRAP